MSDALGLVGTAPIAADGRLPACRDGSGGDGRMPTDSRQHVFQGDADVGGGVTSLDRQPTLEIGDVGLQPVDDLEELVNLGLLLLLHIGERTADAGSPSPGLGQVGANGNIPVLDRGRGG